MKAAAVLPAVVLAALLLAPLASVALGQAGYGLSWWTVDGGGGTSQGGSYALSGTIGQADAGLLEGGGYTLRGGFWATAAAGSSAGHNLYLPLVLH